jgi:signal peptidase I
MDWLASLSIEWVLFVAFALLFGRLLLVRIRPQIGIKTERNIGETIESLLFAWVVVFLIVRPFIFEPFSIPSASMNNTLLEGDRILVSKYLYRFHAPQRGDVIVFKSPPAAGQNEADFVKRLIGLPGDTVDIREGKVYVNGQTHDEPYIKEPMADPPYNGKVPGVQDPPYKVPPGYFLVMGDNRNNSFDGRFWGFLDAKRVKGKAIAIFWPPKRISRLRHPDVGSGPG